MTTIKEFQRKIASLRNSRKITSSMKMISSIKLQKNNRLFDTSLSFRKTAREMAADIQPIAKEFQSPLFSRFKNIKTVLIILITGDRGLCGRFNANTITTFIDVIQQEQALGRNIRIAACGLRGAAYCKRHSLSCELYPGLVANPDWHKVKLFADTILSQYESGAIQDVKMVFSKRISSMSESPCMEQVAPITIAADELQRKNDFIIEGKPDEFLRNSGRLIIETHIYEGIIASVVAEHAARMGAMESASTNCDRLTNKYTQLRNQARQAEITTELNEIVTGKEALEG